MEFSDETAASNYRYTGNFFTAKNRYDFNGLGYDGE